MAKFVDAVLFVPTAGGTTDFTVSAAVNGYMTPALANATNGEIYRYRAESATLTQWEIGYGVYNAGVLARTVVLYNSLGTTAKINFSSAPNVGMGMPIATDIFPTASDTPPTSPADNALWWESDTGILYLYYNDGTSKQWVGIATNAALAAVLYTSQSLSVEQKAQARANIDVLKNNYIINGAMMISQENGAVAGTTSGYFAADQWSTASAGLSGTYTFGQVASTSPAGSPNRLRLTVTAADAAVAAGDLVCFGTKLEGLRVADLMFGTASAKAITIRFGVKAPAGTYSVSIVNNAINRSYVAEFTITGGEANTDVVKSVTIPGDTTGTWQKDNTNGMYVFWGVMAGTTYQQTGNAWGTVNAYGTPSTSNLFATNGNVFELFDVGLYEGSAAPSFQVPDYADELARCQRYYAKTGFDLETPVTSGQDYGTSTQLPVPLRVAVTPTASDTVTLNLGAPVSLTMQGGVSNTTVIYRKRASATGAGSLTSVITCNARL